LKKAHSLAYACLEKGCYRLGRSKWLVRVSTIQTTRFGITISDQLSIWHLQTLCNIRQFGPTY
jgi:hypothetical protein